MTAGSDSSRGMAVRRVTRVLKVLKGHSVDGLTLTEIAEAIRENAPTTLRTLQILAEENMVMKLDTGRWALSVLLLQIAQATASEIDRKSLRLAELKQRITAGGAS